MDLPGGAARRAARLAAGGEGRAGAGRRREEELEEEERERGEMDFEDPSRETLTDSDDDDDELGDPSLNPAAAHGHRTPEAAVWAAVAARGAPRPAPPQQKTRAANAPRAAGLSPPAAPRGPQPLRELAHAPASLPAEAGPSAALPRPVGQRRRSGSQRKQRRAEQQQRGCCSRSRWEPCWRAFPGCGHSSARGAHAEAGLGILVRGQVRVDGALAVAVAGAGREEGGGCGCLWTRSEKEFEREFASFFRVCFFGLVILI